MGLNISLFKLQKIGKNEIEKLETYNELTPLSVYLSS
jgi:hypothetical protein